MEGDKQRQRQRQPLRIFQSTGRGADHLERAVSRLKVPSGEHWVRFRDKGPWGLDLWCPLTSPEKPALVGMAKSPVTCLGVGGSR